MLDLMFCLATSEMFDMFLILRGAESNSYMPLCLIPCSHLFKEAHKWCSDGSSKGLFLERWLKNIQMIFTTMRVSSPHSLIHPSHPSSILVSLKLEILDKLNLLAQNSMGFPKRKRHQRDSEGVFEVSQEISNWLPCSKVRNDGIFFGSKCADCIPSGRSSRAGEVMNGVKIPGKQAGKLCPKSGRQSFCTQFCWVSKMGGH